MTFTKQLDLEDFIMLTKALQEAPRTSDELRKLLQDATEEPVEDAE